MKNQNDSYLQELQQIVDGFRKVWDKDNPNKKRILTRRHDMLARCYITTNDSYEEYGGRGIEVCEAWRKSSRDYLVWFCMQLAKHAPYYDSVSEALDALSIDRINPAKNYTPQNCRLLAREINDYTTSTPSRCLMFKGDFKPFWYAEKFIGWERPSSNKNQNRMSDYLIKLIYAYDNSGSRIMQTHYMLTAQGVSSFKQGQFKDAHSHEAITTAILHHTNGYIWHDFYKEPLIINTKSRECKCNECGGLVEFSYTSEKYDRKATPRKEWRVKCTECDFNALLVANKYEMDDDEVDRLRNLPMKLFNSKLLRARPAKQVQKECDTARQFRARIDSDFAAKRTARVREVNQRYMNAKREALGLKPRKILPREIVPILELQTRKAIRERLKRDKIDPASELYAQARARMVELLRIEKERCKELNPAAYYGARKKYNDKRAKRIKGEDFEIKGKANALYKIHENTPRGEVKKREVKIEYLPSTKELITDAEFNETRKEVFKIDEFDNSQAREDMLAMFRKALK